MIVPGKVLKLVEHQQAAAPPGGIIPESPGGFAGIRIDVAIERLDERDALT